MAANIFIRSVELRPDPAGAGEAFTISGEIGDRGSALADHDGSLITDTDGMGLWIPEGALVLADWDKLPVADADGSIIETEE